jgi:homogentisate 1,2-dioxygenase
MNPYLKSFPHRRRVLTGHEDKIPYSNYTNIPKNLYWDFIGENGFIGHQTFLYKPYRPTVREEFKEGSSGSGVAIQREGIQGTTMDIGAEPIISKPRAFSLNLLKPKIEDNIPTRVLTSSEVNVSAYNIPEGTTTIFCNVDANELLYMQKGRGEIHTEFGVIEYTPFTYVYIPKGTFYRIYGTSSTLILMEIYKQIYLPNFGLLSQDYPIAESLLEGSNLPELRHEVNNPVEGKVSVLKKIGPAYREEIYTNSPLACIGWQGTLYPFKINVKDINVVESHTFHVPPSAYVTFLNEDMSVNIISFLPRFVHTPPYNHRNTSYNEFMFYSRGIFVSRSGVGEGDITVHPIGGHHGPQPKREFFEVKTIEEFRQRFVDEIAIMIESKPLFSMTLASKEIEIKDYALSWHKESIPDKDDE